MTRDDAWMPLYGADFQVATAHMTAAERGAYLDLLLAAWARDGKLPDNDAILCRLARCDAAEWAQVSATVRAKFVAKAGYLTQRRLTLELQKAKKSLEKRRKQTQKATAAAAEKRKPRQGLTSVTDNVTDNVTSDVTTHTTTTTTTKDLKPKPPQPPRTAVAVPGWMPEEIWGQWRKARRPTADAVRLQVKFLGEQRELGVDPAAIIEQSIRNNWKGLFPLNGESKRMARAGREGTHDAIFGGGHEPDPIDITSTAVRVA